MRFSGAPWGLLFRLGAADPLQSCPFVSSVLFEGGAEHPPAWLSTELLDELGAEAAGHSRNTTDECGRVQLVRAIHISGAK